MSTWDPSSTAVVYNPAAANGKVGQDWPRHEAAIRAALGNVRTYGTRGKGDGMARAQEAVKAGCRTVLSMGGDGTHNEVVNGLMRSGCDDPLTLGILPAGTGGDFKRLLQHGSSCEEMLRALPTARRTPLDLGKASYKADSGEKEDRWFVNLANFGIGGLVDRKVNGSSKRLGGKASFYIGTLKALAEYKPAEIRLTIDGSEVGTFKVTNIAVCNGRFAGGGMMFAPTARLSDGLFEVIVVQDGPLHQTLGMTMTIYKGEHLSSPLVKTFRGRHVVAETVTPNPAWLDLDGEAPGILPLEAELVPKALWLLDVKEGVE